MPLIAPDVLDVCVCFICSQLIDFRTKVEKTWLNLPILGENFKNVIVKEARWVREKTDGT